MDQYRSGEVRMLVATDVAARGLDVKDISYVINYDFPVDGVEVRLHSFHEVFLFVLIDSSYAYDRRSGSVECSTPSPCCQSCGLTAFSLPTFCFCFFISLLLSSSTRKSFDPERLSRQAANSDAV